MNTTYPKPDPTNTEDGNSKSHWGRAWSQAYKLFRPKKDTSPPSPPAAQKDRLSELLDRIEKAPPQLDGAVIPAPVQKDFVEALKRHARQGFMDGVTGVPSDFLPVSEASAAQDLQQRACAALAEKELERLGEVVSLQQIAKDRYRQVRLHHDYQDYLHHYSKFGERGTTKAEFWIYLVCAVIIVVADIPLNLEMLRRLFDAGGASEKNVGLANFFRGPWGLLISALGVGMTSIFIKVWYDKYGNRKYGQTFLSQKKFDDLFVDARDTGYLEDASQPVSRDMSPENKLHSKSEWGARLIDWGLLLITLSTIVAMGIFRGYVINAAKYRGQASSIPFSASAATLILLALLLAILSGVCLSISLNSLSTFNRLKESREQGAALESALTDVTTKLQTAEGALAYVRQLLWNTTAQSWETCISSYLKSHYEIGFSEGRQEPGYLLQSLDFYDRVARLRENHVARQVNTHSF